MICSYIIDLNGVVQGIRLQLKKAQSAYESEAQDKQFIIKIIASVPNMIGYWDKELHCQFANNACSHWFTQSPKDLIEVSFREFAGETLYALNDPYIQAVLAGEAQRFERKLEKTNGNISHMIHLVTMLEMSCLK
ncbi:PAS domain-containing protein [Psychromonas sp. MB-3u-54]|uniref:PAS domain-containing protein n=1 Tax=Psychromonas sp. MB-3u-54 TaxID=2058319 RepID=UPI001E3FACE9|nr:PAS domain-containing protein [Psychromonas sp. MB-3u-54]